MKKYTLFYCVIFALFSQNSYAVSEDIINQQNKIIQNQQQSEQDKERRRELREVRKEQKKIDRERQYNLEENDKKIVHDLSAIQCFRIKKIIFSENKILSKWSQRSLTKNYIGQCLTLDQISQISRDISNYLVKKGYVTSRAQVPKQSLSQGILRITIIQSYLEKITFNEDDFLDKMQKFTAFGLMGSGNGKKDEILNLHEIEQGIDQINRLQSNNASAKLFPGNKGNSSIVRVENNPVNTSRINLFYDNNGSKVTGSRRETISLSQDNLLHLNDSFNISRTSNDTDVNRDVKRSSSFSGRFSIPFKRHNFTFAYSRSSYFFVTGEDGDSLRIYGKTITTAVSFDSVLIKNQNVKISSNFNLTSRDNQNFSNDVEQDVSSRKASIFSTSLSNTIFLNKASLFLKPTYSKAINILNAQKDPANIPSNAAHSEFDIFKIYGNYSQQSHIPYLETPIFYNLSFDGQMSQQGLNGNDRFSVGGVYSVRGFGDGSISSDSGYVIKNELSINLGQTILPYVDMENSSKELGYLNYFSITPFYDYGFVRSKGGYQNGRLSGGGFKTSFNYKKTRASLTFSYAISKSQMLLQNHNENSAVYFDISSEFGFF